MNTNALALLALLAGPAHADTWITEQITVSSVDSGQYITGGQTGHPMVTILEFATRDLCENFKATAAFPESRCRCADGDRQLFRSRRIGLH